MITDDSKISSLITWPDFREIASRFLKRCLLGYQPDYKLPPDWVIDDAVDLIGRLAQKSQSARDEEE